jgi:hypothetical protein
VEKDDSRLPNPSNQPNQRDDSSEMLSKAPRSAEKTFSSSTQYNIPSTQTKAQNEHNFITLGKISEQEKIEIIKLGFQLNQEGKVSLKKYYEETEQYSLFQLQGYRIKYENIRRTKFYLKLKP